jgi:type III secretory pathway component EscT
VGAEVSYYGLASFLTPHKIFWILCGLFFAFINAERISLRMDGTALSMAAKGAGAIFLFLFSVVTLSAHNFNPFIYFRF